MKEVLIKPVVTEKSMWLSGQSKYEFEVGRDANKSEIGKAVEEMYKVNVLDVNIIRRKPKARRYGRTTGFTKAKKLAIVTVKKDQKIELIEESK